MIRHAVAEDEKIYMALVRAYLHEMLAKGSEVIPTERTLTYYAGLFWDAVVTQETAEAGGHQDGMPPRAFLLIEYPVAFTLAREVVYPYDTAFGKTAVGVGTYVAQGSRGRGLSKLLRVRLAQHLQELDFQTLLGMVGTEDVEAGAALRGIPGLRVWEYQRLVRADLGGPAAG